MCSSMQLMPDELSRQQARLPELERYICTWPFIRTLIGPASFYKVNPVIPELFFFICAPSYYSQRNSRIMCGSLVWALLLLPVLFYIVKCNCLVYIHVYL